MSHAINRTSPIGTKFYGTCLKCGEEELTLGGALLDCPKDNEVSDEQALLLILEEGGST